METDVRGQGLVITLLLSLRSELWGASPLV